MKLGTLFVLAVLLTILARVAPAESHAARGIVLKVDSAQRLLIVSCEEIPGYMAAMEMEFAVREPNALAICGPALPLISPSSRTARNCMARTFTGVRLPRLSLNPCKRANSPR